MSGSHYRTKIKPEFTTGEKPNLNRHWRGLFLDLLAETSNVAQSARRAGINASRAYKIRREEPEFARRWRAALTEGYEHLELETLNRLRFGTGKDEARFDIANALRLLAMHKETIAREQARLEDGDEGEVIASINAKIAAMRQREKEIQDDLLADGVLRIADATEPRDA